MASVGPSIGVTHPVEVAKVQAAGVRTDPNAAPIKLDKDQTERQFKLHAATIGMIVSGILLAIGITLTVLRNQVGGIKIPLEVTDKITSISTQLFITFIIYYVMHKSFTAFMDRKEKDEKDYQLKLKEAQEAVNAASPAEEKPKPAPVSAEEPKIVVIDDWKKMGGGDSGWKGVAPEDNWKRV
jgi:hypothetical protein